MFNIGDRIKCINNKPLTSSCNPPKLVMNREYIIYDIDVCSCGDISFDVGLHTVLELMECLCGKIEYDTKAWWCSSKRFIKIQETKEYIAVTSNVEIKELTLN